MKQMILCITIVAAIVSLAGISSCKSSNASESKALKFNLEPGKGYDYEMVWDIETKAPERQSNSTIASLYFMKVTKSEEGTKTIATAYKSLRMDIKENDMALTISSDNTVQAGIAGDEGGQLINVMNKVFAGIIGKEFIIKVNEEGIQEVSGFEEIVIDMINSMQIDEGLKVQAAVSMRDQFSNEALKDQLGQVFNIFPNKEIKKGDTWNKSLSTRRKMPSTFSTTYTVKEIEGDHVTLDTKTKISADAGDIIMEGTQTGIMIVDIKTGLLITAAFDQRQQTTTGDGVTMVTTGKGMIKGRAN